MGRIVYVVTLVCLFAWNLAGSRAWAGDDEQKQDKNSKAKKVAADKDSSSNDDSEELKRLRQEAGLAIDQTERESEKQIPKLDTNTVFSSGNRALQALNPELSVVVDAGGRVKLINYDTKTFGDDSQFYFRVLGLHFQANLDPFSFFKAAIEFHTDGVELGEAYATWTNVVPGLNLTLGKFRQQFGVVQRWHAHSLDQFDFPLAITTLLGPDGLNQIGFSLEWIAPSLWADDQRLVLQVTNTSNEHLFNGQQFGVPAGLLHWSQYYDLSDSTYLEFGLTGMVGANNKRNLTDDNGGRLDEPWRTTTLAGSDLTVSWSPLHNERYKHLTWRSEFYWIGRETADGYLAAGGGYSYLDAGLSEALAIGVRGDLTQPYKVDNDGRWIWQAVGYLTWWESPWVRTRFQYAHKDGDDQEPEDLFVIQVVFAAGPHKHDRY
ncbi:MAG: hypothetical protein GXP49_01485 [Deltaproteobacteria bacterium]|nr:hypothetical protein [Deltaproteobacteria bacterium]